MFKNAIYSTLGFALNVTICKSLHFALLHLDILMDYIINCITHETCKVNCARLCTIEHMLHIQVWKILQFAVFVAPKLLNLFFKKHGLAHENVQVIAHCTFWICNSAIYCTTFWKFILHFMNIPMCKILHFAVQYFKSAHPHIICTVSVQYRPIIYKSKQAYMFDRNCPSFKTMVARDIWHQLVTFKIW